MGRLKKTEGAEAIRLRWYGGMDVDTIFVERKTHREDWTGEKSVKARFATKEKNINAVLEGKMTVDQVFEKMRKDGKKSEKEIADLEQLAREIQYRIIDRKLIPIARSFYHRTAFQLPGDARVRVSLDTELSMIREDNMDGRQRAGKNWRRMDIGIDYPFSQLPPEDIVRFPYAVLEVKLQTQAGQQPPEWIRELTASHLVEAVPKFSKFIHGNATLFPTRINLLPFWMPQMDVDIRKPVSHRFGIERPGTSQDLSTSDFDDDSDDEDQPEPIVEDRDNEDLVLLRAARDVMERHDLERRADQAEALSAEQNGAPRNELDSEERVAALPIDGYPLYDSDSEDEDVEEARRVGGWYYYRIRAANALKNTGRAVWTGLSFLAPVPRPTQLPRDAIRESAGVSQFKRFKAPPGKSKHSNHPSAFCHPLTAATEIHVPVRVEPKVAFATERTFLDWLQFSLILGSIATTLLNFGDAVSVASASAFTAVAAAAILYSLALYLWRVEKIRLRKAVTYHDKWGPSILCVGLLAAVAVNIGLRFGGLGGGMDFRD